MVKRRSIFQKLPKNYLFPEINRRKELFMKQNPSTTLISLGIGDTVEPLSPYIAKKIESAAASLGTKEGYRGYGKEQGFLSLREKLITRFYHGKITPDEIFISDGAKCDLGRLQMLFGGKMKVAMQDPAYPVYLEGSLLQGVESITLMPCIPDNDFFPDLSTLDSPDLIYICHPNNPTGACYTYKQLKKLVDYAIDSHAIILFDVAYASFIREPFLPKTIYEIPGAEKVAIEVGSFSKMAGFSGLRLGWTTIPKTLKFEDGHLVWNDWMRMNMSIYNGASLLAQQGGIAALEDEGWDEINQIIDQYLRNAKRLRQAFEKQKLTVYGGKNIPYLWVHYPNKNSWDIFQEFLEQRQIIITPGKGFGVSGEHFIRVSGFAHEKQIDQSLNLL